MILPDYQIREYCLKGMVDPFRNENIQPASLDVTLYNEFRTSSGHSHVGIDLNDPPDITNLVESDHFVLHPGEFVLGVTEEIVKIPHDIVSRIEGKSSLGRLGLAVHVTAGFIDPGFNGRVTLEMVNLNRLPIILRAGKLVAQLSFQFMTAPSEQPYQGRYQGDLTAAPSRYGQ